MKLRSFTLIETIVAMLIVSILAGLVAIITLNFYRSIPSASRSNQIEKNEQVADSLFNNQRLRPRAKRKIGGYEFSYQLKNHTTFDSIQVVHFSIVDSMNNETAYSRYVRKEAQ